MPLFYQHTIDESTKLAIWKIEEEEAFFLQQVPLSRSVTHPHKRLQHLAGRYLLPLLFPGFPLSEIKIADTRKPYLEHERYHFSISHCGDYAAVIASKTSRVGIDIELVSPAVRKVQSKFISEEDARHAIDSVALLSDRIPVIEDILPTVFWSVKEAVFKWYGKGKVDFKQHIRIRENVYEETGSLQVPVLFAKEGAQPLLLTAKSFSVPDPGPLILSWIATGK